MPICFQVVPEPAASKSRRMKNLGVGQSVGNPVLVVDFGLDQHTDEVVVGCSRRAATIGAMISMIRSGWEGTHGHRGPARSGHQSFR